MLRLFQADTVTGARCCSEQRTRANGKASRVRIFSWSWAPAASLSSAHEPALSRRRGPPGRLGCPIGQLDYPSPAVHLDLAQPLPLLELPPPPRPPLQRHPSHLRALRITRHLAGPRHVTSRGVPRGTMKRCGHEL